MAAASALSKAWTKQKSHVGAYTGGHIIPQPDGNSVLASCSERVSVWDVTTGLVSTTLQGRLPVERREPILHFALSPADPDVVISASRGLLLRKWSLSTGEVQSTWSGPRAPVTAMTFHASGTLLATGAADGSVMVWDVEGRFCTHSFKGHTRPIVVAVFHSTRLLLVTTSEDTDVRVWDLNRKKQQSACVATLTAHESVPTSVAFAPGGGDTMLTAGRDKMLFVWDTNSFAALAEVPVFEAVEAAVVLPPADDGGVASASEFTVVTGGDKGLVRTWAVSVRGTVDRVASVKAAQHVTVQALLGPGDAVVHTGSADTDVDAAVYHQLVGMFVCGPHLACVTADHNLVVLQPHTLAVHKTLIGFNDEVVDIKYVPGRVLGKRTAAVATNSSQLRLVDVDTFDTRLFDGHSATVLFVDPSPDGRFVATSSKDRAVRVWETASGRCVAIGEGHTHAVGCVVWPHRARTFGGKASTWLVSGSVDKTLKRWDAFPVAGDGVFVDAAASPVPLRSVAATVAHTKDINYLAVSPNDALVASASQDKTVKLWSTTDGDLQLRHTFTGHKRGVWTVHFSPVDRCLASGSGDGTVRLWSLVDYQCLCTLQGVHTASVLSLQFIRGGTQLLSGGADGLINLWTIKDSECIATYEAHDKVWALAVDKGGDDDATAELEMMSGGTDSVLSVWRDTTADDDAAAMAATEERLLAQQELFNKMALRDYKGALELCIRLEHPQRLQAILQELLDVGPTKAGGVDWKDQMVAEVLEISDEQAGRTWRQVPAVGFGGEADTSVEHIPSASDLNKAAGRQQLGDILRAFSHEPLNKLLVYLRDWNTQSRHALFAQQLLECVVRSIPASRLRSCASFRDSVEAMVPYTSRHLERMDRLLQSAYFVDYTLAAMQQLVPSTDMVGSLGVEPPVVGAAGAGAGAGAGASSAGGGGGGGGAAAAATTAPDASGAEASDDGDESQPPPAATLAATPVSDRPKAGRTSKTKKSKKKPKGSETPQPPPPQTDGDATPAVATPEPSHSGRTAATTTRKKKKSKRSRAPATNGATSPAVEPGSAPPAAGKRKRSKRKGKQAA